MFRLRNFLFLFLSVFCVNQSNACESIMNDFPNEIKTYAGESTVRELNGRYYVDSGLLSLQEDGIHLIYGEKNILIPFMYHDTNGYFLSPEACHNLGDRWMCCQCNCSNKMLIRNCRRCLRKRCGA